MGRLKLCCRIPSLADTTSFYRAAGPLSDLRKQMDLECYEPSKYNWATMMGADALFMQRPYTKDDVGIMEMALRFKVPVWVDYDDFLFDLPTDNPSYSLYMNEDRQKNMAYIINKANHVTVSTQALKDRLIKFNSKVTVIPNAIDLKVNSRPRSLPKRQKRVTWRGSRTHHRDVFSVIQSIMLVHKQFPDWEWHFFGDNLWLLTDNMTHLNTFVVEPTDWAEYFDNIFAAAPSIMMAPLHEHGFNHCKSNIAWIEAAYAGAPTIAPDWPEWNRPGCLNYKSEHQFKEIMTAVLSGDVDVEAEAAKAWEYIQEELSLTKVNRLRIEVLKSL